MYQLRNKWLKIRVSEQGGALIDGTLNDGRDFLRPYNPSSQSFNILEASCFPLVPIGNRVSDNAFVFDGRQYQLSKNSSESPFYLHGDGWLASWALESVADESIAMSLRHRSSKKSPYDYLAKQRIRLDGRSLILELVITNCGETLPFGLGLHPYFPGTSDMQLCAKAGIFWTLDERNLPKDRFPLTKTDYFGQLSSMVSGLDNCFSDWDGVAQIVYPEKELRIEISCSESFKHYLVYSPAEQDYFCFEPMTHVPNCLNMLDYGSMQILQKGETLSGELRLTVSDIE